MENLRKLYFTLDNTLKENGTSMTEHEIKAFIKNSRAFKPNVTIPSYATSLKDGSGRYVWRNMVKPSELSQDSDIYDMTFANGSFYIYEQINFFLRRQDPFGEYGLKYTSGKTGSNNSLLNFSVDGNKKDIVNYEYVKENEMKC